MVDGAQRTVVRSYQLDLRCQTELRIQVKELQSDDAYLSKVIDDKKSWFTRMEVRDLIYYQLFIMANSLGRQPTTSQYFQPLAPQTSALVAAAIHCALSGYAGGNKATVRVSQYEYRGTVCPSPMINFTAKATALINHTLVGRLEPPPPSHHHAPPLCQDRRSSIPVGAPQPRFTLFYILLQSIPPFSVLLCCDWHSIIPSFLI